MTREANRAAMPETAALLDEFRAVFGKPQWFRVEEAGKTVEWGERTAIGTPCPASVQLGRLSCESKRQR